MIEVIEAGQVMELAPFEVPTPQPMARQASGPTPADMLMSAIASGADLERVKLLMDLQDRYDAKQAERAFEEAMAEFKRDPPDVVKDMVNKQYSSKYSSLANFVGTVNPYLGKHGLSADFGIDQSSGIKVTCFLTHRLGHKKFVSMTAPPDTSGQKNPIQQIKSTITYLKLATFEAVTGISARDPEAEDDGNGSGKGKPQDPPKEMTKEQIAAQLKADHTAAAEKHKGALIAIRDLLWQKKPKEAYTIWARINTEDQKALWLPPAKGGCLSTDERKAIKDFEHGMTNEERAVLYSQGCLSSEPQK